MEMRFQYRGRSQLSGVNGARTLALAANLARDPVAFDAPLTSPLRFREAISALHDVVISDLRYTPRDKSAYDAWKQNERQRLAAVHRETLKQAKQEILARRADVVLEDARHVLPETLGFAVTQQGCVRTFLDSLDMGTPERSGMDGFFAARLRRKG